MSHSAPRPRRIARWFSAAACMIAGASFTVAIGAAFSSPPAAAPASQPLGHVPANLSVTSARICAAAVVYERAAGDDWALRAVLARTALNSFDAAGAVPDCAADVAAALLHDFSPRRWQDALDAVDAVTSGAYAVPDACARANTIVELSPGSASAPDSPPAASPAVVRTQCVISNFAFAEVLP